MVLLFSKVIGVFGWGMLSALAMAAGTSLTISSLEYWFLPSTGGKLSGNKTPGAVATGRLDDARAGGRGDSAGSSGDDVDECGAGGKGLRPF